jgi:hypothetical protein
MSDDTTNVVAFRRPGGSGPVRHPRRLIESVYAAGSLPVAGDDIPTKTAALMLQALGFLIVEEVQPDGSPRRLSRGEARTALRRPWRLSKPAFSGETGVPDACGAFVPA